MEFEYQSSIWITDEDLNEMAKRVRAGEDFHRVFHIIMVKYDDKDYYNRGLIADAVEKEVMRRVANGKD